MELASESVCRLRVHLLSHFSLNRECTFDANTTRGVVFFHTGTVSQCTVSFQMKLSQQRQSGSLLGAAAADGFLVDRAWLVGIKTLGHAYAADMRLLAQLFHCLCLLLSL